MQTSERQDSGPPTGDRFKVLRTIGRGGAGVVYAAFDRQRNEVVALKTMREVDPGSVYRLKQEFRALTNFSHPRLVALHELLSDGEQWFFTMELVAGVGFLEYVRPGERSVGSSAPASGPITDSTLSYRLPAREPFTPITAEADAGPRRDTLPTLDCPSDRVVEAPEPAVTPCDFDRLRRAFGQLAEGLIALHGFGCLHRDIKPSNVLVTPEGRLVLLDFGLATSLARGGRSGRDGSRGGEVSGTPEYMSPEQLQGQPLTEASDWYCVGVLLYQALTGRLPHPTDRSNVSRLLEERLTLRPRIPETIQQAAPELSALVVELLEPRPERRPAGTQVLKFLGGKATPPGSTATAAPAFFGRERELELLRRAFGESAEGPTRVVYVTGASGMGKSALVRHFLDQIVERDGAVVLEGHCYERESVPYKGLDSLIDALSSFIAGLGEDEVEAILPRNFRALTRVFPVLETVKGPAAASARSLEVPDPQELRRRAFSALGELMGRLGDRHPLVLHIDDFQWGDRDSAGFIGELVRPADSPNLLLILSFRREGDTLERYQGLLPEPSAERSVSTIEVGPLLLGDAVNLAQALLPAAEREAAPLIARESGGSPFFVDELVRYHHLIGETRARGTLDEVIRLRQEQLPADALRLLEVVAVAGRPLSLSVARAAASIPPGEHDAVTTLRAANFIRLRGATEDLVETFHDRVREVAVGRLTPSALRERHRALATTLRASGPVDPETLLEHLEAAGELDDASSFAVQAARSAERALAFERAARLYQRAIRLAPSGSAVQGLHGALADALANAGRAVEAAEAYLQATQGEPRRAAASEFKRRAAEQFLASGHIDEGLRVTAEVLQVVGMSMPPTPFRALLSLLLRRAILRVRGLRFHRRRPEELSESELLRIDLCWAVARGLGMVDTIRASDFQTRHLLMALAAGEPYRITRGLALEAAFVATSGRPASARVQRLLQAARETATSVDNPHATGLTALMGGACAYLVGDWRSTVTLCGEAVPLLKDRCTGVAWELATAHVFTLGSLMYLGETRELRRRASELMVEALERGNLYLANDIRCRNNLIWLVENDPVAARRELDASRMEWSKRRFFREHYNSLLARVQIDLYEGNGLTALERVRAAWQDLRRSILLRIQLLRTEAHYLLGRAALAASDENGDTDLLRMAEREARAIEREDVLYAEPLALVLRAGVAARRAQRPQGVVRLEQAIAGFQRTGMGLYRAAARRMLGRLIGGNQGQALVGEADQWMKAQDVVAPARMAWMLAPVVPPSEDPG